MKAHRRSWLLIVLSGTSLTACSSQSDLLPPPPLVTTVAPVPDKAIAGARTAAEAEKLIDPIEVSAVRQGRSVGPGDFMLCIRGARSPTDPRLTYAAFFQNDEYKDIRPSVILDECEKQAYTPLPAPAPNPAAALAKHQKRHQVQQ